MLFQGSSSWKRLLPIEDRAKICRKASRSSMRSRLSAIPASAARTVSQNFASEGASDGKPSGKLRAAKVRVRFTRLARLPISSPLTFSWKSFQVNTASDFSGRL